MCWQFGQNNCCHGLLKVAHSVINCPIWSHWLVTAFHGLRQFATTAFYEFHGQVANLHLASILNRSRQYNLTYLNPSLHIGFFYFIQIANLEASASGF